MKTKYAIYVDKYLSSSLKYGTNFDVVRREVGTHRHKGTIYYLTSLVSEVAVASMLEGINDIVTNKTATKTLLNGNVYTKISAEEAFIDVTNGVAALILDSENYIIMIDVRYYPTRSVSEPTTEQTIRGSKDGFTESININVGLIRRRIKDHSFTIQNYIISSISKTYVSVIYLDDIVNKSVLKEIDRRLTSLDIESLVMSDRALEELILDQKHNPFPLVRYTERPDIASISLIKGKILILVDTSSSVLILPSTIFEHTYHVEEFRQSPLVGTFTRCLRNIAIILSFTILPFWLSLVSDDGYNNGFSLNLENNNMQLIVIQMLICEFVFELLRIASIHTPSTISGTIGLIAAVILSQVALDLGLFLPEIILLCAISAICQFVTPSYELSLANKLVKIFLILLVAFLGKSGLLIGLGFVFMYLSNINLFGLPYLYPFCPLDIKKALNFISRSSAKNKTKL